MANQKTEQAINPFQSPLAESTAPASPAPKSTEPYVGGTIVARHLAASGDMLIAIVLALIAGSQIPEDERLMQFGAMTAVWFGYYLVSEAVFSRTLGKLLAGLVVLQLNGTRITIRQAFVRTLFRLLEVNPVFIGALPAALCIIFSRRRQRIGDRAAGTVVASVRQMRKQVPLAERD
jgi:uncharacterized RDD family membrane protein YckC